MESNGNREEAIRQLQKYRDDLLGSIQQFKADLAAVSRSLELLDGTGAPKGHRATPNMKGYGDLGHQGAVEQFLREHPNQLFRPSVLGRKLVAVGFHPRNPKLHATQVHSACLRATKKGVADRIKVDGKSRYRLARGELNENS